MGFGAFLIPSVFLLLPTATLDAWTWAEALTAALILAVSWRKEAAKGVRVPRSFAPWGIFLAWTVLAGLAAADHPGEFLIDLRRVALPALAVFGLARLPSSCKPAIRAGLLAPALLLAAWVLLERAGGSPRPAGPWSNPNITASVLIAAGLYVLPTVGRSFNRSWTSLGLAGTGMALIFAAAGVAGSRGAVMAMILALVFAGLTRRRSAPTQGTKHLLRLTLGAAFLIVLAYPSLDRLRRGPQGDSLSYSRILIYPAAARMALDNPGLGLGWGQFGIHYGPYKDPAVGLYGTAYPHSAWLHVLVETGLIGLALLVLGWFWVLRDLGRKIPEAAEGEADWAVGARIGLVFLFLHGLVDENLYMAGPAFFALVLALEAGRELDWPWSGKWIKGLALLAFLGSAAVLLGLSQFTGARGDLSRKSGRLAARRFQQARILLPFHQGPLLGLAQVEASVGNMEKSLAFTRRALRLAPRDIEAWFSLLELLASGQDGPGAAAAARRIAALDPRNALVRRRLGELLERAGDLAGARRELEEALRLLPDWDEASVALRRLEGESRRSEIQGGR